MTITMVEAENVIILYVIMEVIDGTDHMDGHQVALHHTTIDADMVINQDTVHREIGMIPETTEMTPPERIKRDWPV